jgi:hypothetical protein
MSQPVKGTAYRIKRRRSTRGELLCRESRLAKDREWFRELVETVRRASGKPEGEVHETTTDDQTS